MFEGAYPPGITGEMIDFIDPVEYPEECATCTYFEERTCGQICSLAEGEYSAEELEAMTDDEYMTNFGKKPDDCCNEYIRWED